MSYNLQALEWTRDDIGVLEVWGLIPFFDDMYEWRARVEPDFTRSRGYIWTATIQNKKGYAIGQAGFCRLQKQGKLCCAVTLTRLYTMMHGENPFIPPRRSDSHLFVFYTWTRNDKSGDINVTEVIRNVSNNVPPLGTIGWTG